MKARKKKTMLKVGARNALYNKTIKHNHNLSNTNTALSIKINKLENAIKQANKKVWYKPWTYFMKPISIDQWE
jgi:hypothetical protein